MAEQNIAENHLTSTNTLEKYYGVILACNGIQDVPVSFLMAISKHIGYGTGDEKLIWLGGYHKENIMSVCGCSRSSVDRLIKLCVERGILGKTEYRGTYTVASWLIPGSKWTMIKDLKILIHCHDTVQELKTEIAYFDDIPEE